MPTCSWTPIRPTTSPSPSTTESSPRPSPPATGVAVAGGEYISVWGGAGATGLSKRDVVDILKVSSKSNPNSVAGALAGVVRRSGAVEIQVVGAGALNQAVKAIAIARGYLVGDAVDLACVPTFAEILIDGESRTAIRLLVEPRPVLVPTAEVVDIATGSVTLDVTDEAVAVAAVAVATDLPA